MKKLFTANKYLPIALVLAGFAAAGTAPASAQSAGTWSSGISARNARPYVRTPSNNDSGYSSYAQAPATILLPAAQSGLSYYSPATSGYDAGIETQR
jgi:hypothetical protein